MFIIRGGRVCVAAVIMFTLNIISAAPYLGGDVETQPANVADYQEFRMFRRGLGGTIDKITSPNLPKVPSSFPQPSLPDVDKPSKYEVYGTWTALCNLNTSVQVLERTTLATNTCAVYDHAMAAAPISTTVLRSERIASVCLNSSVSDCSSISTSSQYSASDIQLWDNCAPEDPEWQLNVGWVEFCDSATGSDGVTATYRLVDTLLWVNTNQELKPDFCKLETETYDISSSISNGTAKILFVLTCRPDLVNNALIAGASGIGSTIGVMFFGGLIFKWYTESKRKPCKKCCALICRKNDEDESDDEKGKGEGEAPAM